MATCLSKPNKRIIDVLGTKWTICVEPIEKKYDDRGCEAYCDNSIKTIFIGLRDSEPDDVEDLNFIKQQYVRHELIHAFMYESGLGANSMTSYSWALNEEMVDWWALQFRKVEKVFNELEV